MPRSREETFLPHYLFGNKIIQNCLKIDTAHWYDSDLLLRQEIKKQKKKQKKTIAYPGNWFNNN